MTETKRQVLIVDDELDALQNHLAELETAGYGVTTFKSTDEALKSIFDGGLSAFDVIVLDMMIPPPEENPELIDVWDGLRSGGHLLGIIRQHATSNELVPVLLLSNLAEEEIELEAWDRFSEWLADCDRPVPDARNSQEVRERLRQHFRTWIRAKRRTPPWHFPKVIGEMLAETAVASPGS